MKMMIFRNVIRQSRRTLKIICVFLILFAFIPVVYAEEYDIVVTQRENQSSEDIIINPSTIDVPIKVKGYDDIYAFSLKMNYIPENINVESIALGDIFNDYGNAVLKNRIDNENGSAEFMQTLLGIESGVNSDGILCVIRITFSEGEHDIINDLGLEIKIANSLPEYVDTYIPSFKVVVNNTVQDSLTTPSPTLEPLGTVSIGIVTPDPSSETSIEFTAAEDKDAEEILEEINQMEEQQNTTPEKTVVQSTTSPQESNTAVNQNSNTPNINNNPDENNTIGVDIILIIVLIVLIITLAAVIIYRYRTIKK